MVKVGILGDHGKTITINILAQLCKNSGMKVSIVKDPSFIVCLHNNEVSFFNYMNELDKNNFDMAIVKLTEEGLKKDWFSNIHFDVIIYTTGRSEEEYNTLYSRERRLFFTLPRDSISIINADDRRVLKLLNGKKTRFITYGFNSKASITASSIQQEEQNKRVQFCVQRTLITFSGKQLEPQEFSITLPLNQDQEVYSVLAAITAAMINDIHVSDQILLKKYF